MGVAAAAHYSALRTGYLLDDFLHVSMLRGTFPAPRHPLDLYNFVDDTDRATMFERGLLPWWSHEHLTIRFMRPLSSALIWLDHRVLGENVLLMHVHSLAWWALVVLAAFAVYRKFFGERVARIGVFVLALAPCQTMPLAWLANRDALISLGIGLPALYVYTRARETLAARDRLLAFVLFAFAFLGGEYTLSLAAYVLTYELVRTSDSIALRAIGLTLFGLPLVVYMAVRTRLGYGTVGSGFYTDPFTAPEYFLWVAPRRFATCLLNAWLALDSRTLGADVPDGVLYVLAPIVAFVVIRALRHVLRERDPSVRRAALWLGVGSVIAIAPVLAVMSGQRVLGAVMFGVAPIVALVLDGAWFPRVIEPRRGVAELTQLAALGLGFAHLIYGPGVGAVSEARIRDTSAQFRRQMNSVHALVGDAATADAVVVRGTFDSFFVPFGIEPDGRTPRAWAVLAAAQRVLVIRTGERELDLYAEADSGAFPPGEGNLFLDAGFLITTGTVFHAPGFTATISEMSEGRVTGVHFAFDEAFQNRVWLAETTKQYFPAHLPSIGEGRPYSSDR